VRESFHWLIFSTKVLAVTGWLLVLTAGGWVLGWVLAGPRRALPGRSLPSGARVSVVVPARDEARRLPRLLDGLAHAAPRPDEVIVVDDGSTDGTADLVRAHGVRVLVAGEPPAGWTGKAYACQRGADAARGDVLVFLDADVEPSGAAISHLAALALRTGGVVSAHPRHRVVKPYERLSAGPALVALLGAGTGGPARRGWWRRPFAFGPALAMPALVYRRIGGHAAVRSSIVDDVSLAARADQAGAPITSLLGGSDLTYRMYPDGPGGLVEGWTKNLAAGGRAVPPVRLAAVVAWVAAALQAAVGPLVLSPIGTAVYLLFAVQFLVLTRRIGRFGPATAVLYPVSLAAFVVLFIGSLVLTAGPGRVRWRGRVVDLRHVP
jgi:4,4'-diaponeurosporenoate glycosyltransferase